MTATGVVRRWDVEDGWGVIDSPETPGGCWAHFSSLIGFGDLQPGEAVTFDYEAGQQDGYDFRATEVQPTGREPTWPTVVVTGPTEAYRSTLTITSDDPDGPEPWHEGPGGHTGVVMIRFMGEDTVDVPLWGDHGLMFATPEDLLKAFGPLGLSEGLVTEIVAWARAWQTDADTPEHDAEAVRLVRQLATELAGRFQIVYQP